MTSPNADKRTESETLLKEVFALMEYPAKLEFKDLTDGALGVAVHFEGELPGIAPGKRSPVLDSVQFWLNKVVNRPNSPRRWVNLGNGEFPPPRPPQGQPREPQQSGDAAPVAAPAPAAKPAREPKAEREKKAAPAASAPPPSRHSNNKHVDERSLKPAADAAISAAAKLLAEKSVKHGRIYSVMGLSNDQRALMLQAADAVKGQHAKAEGEGHWRRLTVTPEKLTVIPRKQVMPDYDDEDEDE